jgi:hypothetical protein
VVHPQPADNRQPLVETHPAVLQEDAPVGHAAAGRGELPDALGFVVVLVEPETQAPGELVGRFGRLPGVRGLQIGQLAVDALRATLFAGFDRHHAGHRQLRALAQSPRQRTVGVETIDGLCGRRLQRVRRDHHGPQPGVIAARTQQLCLPTELGIGVDVTVVAQPGRADQRGIVGVRATRVGRTSGAIDLRIKPPGAGLGRTAAVAAVEHGRAFAARFHIQARAQAVLRPPGDDVDDAVDRVRAPDRTSRSADDLDAFDVGQRHALGFPHHAGKQRRVDAAAVDQHLQLVGEAPGIAAHPHRPPRTRQARHIHARRQAQRFRQ